MFDISSKRTFHKKDGVRAQKTRRAGAEDFDIASNLGGGLPRQRFSVVAFVFGLISPPFHLAWTLAYPLACPPGVLPGETPLQLATRTDVHVGLTDELTRCGAGKLRRIDFQNRLRYGDESDPDRVPDGCTRWRCPIPGGECSRSPSRNSR